MSSTKLCKASVHFSSYRRKHDFYQCICLNDDDFCHNIEKVKKHICDTFRLDNIVINMINFDYVEVFE